MSESEKLPEQKLLDGIESGQVPDDLQWMVDQFKMQPNDPAFLLLIWHWQRIAKVKDLLHVEANTFRAAIEVTVEKAECHLVEWQKVAQTITVFQKMLATLSRDMGQRLESGMQKPIADSLTASRQLEAQLNGLLVKVVSQNKQSLFHLIVGCILSGFAASSIFISWILFRLFSR